MFWESEVSFLPLSNKKYPVQASNEEGLKKAYSQYFNGKPIQVAKVKEVEENPLTGEANKCPCALFASQGANNTTEHLVLVGIDSKFGITEPPRLEIFRGKSVER